MWSSSATHKSGEDRPQTRDTLPAAGVLNCVSPQELYRCVTEEYHRSGIAVEQERGRIAAIVQATLPNSVSRAAAPPRGIFADRMQRDELADLEGMSSVAQKLSFLTQNPVISAMELRMADRHCLDATRTLEGLTKPPLM
ncbi:hypothetical protein ABB37_04045 [Leptomonas pyrrhocoris]|uniref:Uncharacterized protein n=1 Tax=Leptomonas pyrrhocoris TaxID=157538 RepID=A0A0N1J4Y7_LEPPY|nr:hypothetical protein ABB37_04045 [Leptomonas pyrrhocoris]KPA81758.1 hypothetical protein ABB37_04045 [Leptomonas pyrrhocoris]|eukprot:XP_015660197.1 hypothetical protein ABB37_04045 [Leptomonas pyrrhocoris]